MDGVTEIGAYIPVSHEILLDSGAHTCTEDCPPPYVPQPVPLTRRVRYFLRRRMWGIKRIPGYRLVHKDDIGNEDY